MNNFLDICIASGVSIEDTMKIIEYGNVKIALVVNKDNQLLGTISDGDIRRGLLKGSSINDSINNIYNTNPVTVRAGSNKDVLKDLCSKCAINQIPILDQEDRIVDLFILDYVYKKREYKNQVVLMVGGLGTRLRPLTENIPKPMLKVGDRPILQTIVEGFVKSGFYNITMCLGYKSGVIQSFFEDGSMFGANIDYIVEEKRMGTAGALTLLQKKIDGPFFVMNGDLLTNVNYENMLDFHTSNRSKATMCVREYDIEVPYGVVKINQEKITSIEEKPVHSFFVNAGIYLLEPLCIDMIPNNKFYDMPLLFEDLILNNYHTVSFPLKEYWIDIGKRADFDKANSEYFGVF